MKRAAVVATLAVLAVGCTGHAQPVAAPTSPPATQPVGTPSATAPVTASPSPSVRPSPAAPPRPRDPLQLQPGDTGPRVLALQQRLSALGYWLGTPDATFGDSTEQAVYALQKAAGLARDGVVGPATRAALAAGVRPPVRPVSGHVVEVDLSRQLLLLVTGAHLDAILNTSTGGGYTFVLEGRATLAVTPTGWFAVSRQVDAWDRSPLGELWRPKYFVGGVAIHGYPEVPPYPVSHGCVRVSIAAMNWIWDSGLVPLGTSVWVY